MIDLNDAPAQRSSFDLIPHGTKVLLQGTLRAGGISRDGKEELDDGWLTESKNSDVLYLSWEFTVISEGKYFNRKLWNVMTVEGGDVDERGQSKGWLISQATLRAICNAISGHRADDASEEAKAARQFTSWGQLDGVEFPATVTIQKEKPDSQYQDKNRLGQVLEPGHANYDAVMAGETIEADAAKRVGARTVASGGWQKPRQAPAATQQASLNPAVVKTPNGSFQGLSRQAREQVAASPTQEVNAALAVEQTAPPPVPAQPAVRAGLKAVAQRPAANTNRTQTNSPDGNAGGNLPAWAR